MGKQKQKESQPEEEEEENQEEESATGNREDEDQSWSLIDKLQEVGIGAADIKKVSCSFLLVTVQLIIFNS